MPGKYPEDNLSSEVRNSCTVADNNIGGLGLK
jgi:hypothetical protein